MPVTILIADSNAEMRRLTDLALRLAGYAILQAADGPGALALAAAYRPDLIVADVKLAKLSGIELVARLRVGGDGGPPALLLSGRHRPAALPARSTFLAKPFAFDRLQREVAHLLHPIA